MADEDQAAEASAEGVEPADLSGEMGSILVIDPDPMMRNLAEDLEDELDRQVVAMDSVDFDPAASEEVQAAAVFIIAWDLGVRSGVDLVEAIRREERLAGRPVIAALDAPTPRHVISALAFGADSVCVRPYDLDEVSARLGPLEADRAG